MQVPPYTLCSCIDLAQPCILLFFIFPVQIHPSLCIGSVGSPMAVETRPSSLPWQLSTACPNLAHSTTPTLAGYGSQRPRAWISWDGLCSVMASPPTSSSHSLCQCLSQLVAGASTTKSATSPSSSTQHPSVDPRRFHLRRAPYLGRLPDSPAPAPCLGRFHLADRLHYITIVASPTSTPVTSSSYLTTCEFFSRWVHPYSLCVLGQVMFG